MSKKPKNLIEELRSARKPIPASHQTFRWEKPVIPPDKPQPAQLNRNMNKPPSHKMPNPDHRAFPTDGTGKADLPFIRREVYRKGAKRT